MDIKKIEQLREIETKKVVLAIANSFRDSLELHATSNAVYAASYVLMRSLEDYQINVDSMDYYFATAKEPESRELFIRDSLKECWNNIRELKYKFSADEFKAVLLFHENSAMKGSNEATPVGVAKLAAKLINVEPGKKILDMCSGTAGFIRECFIEEPDASYDGVDINTEDSVVADIRAELLGENVQVHVGNVFDPDVLPDRYDAVFAHYPIGLRVRGLGKMGDEYSKKFSEIYPELSKLSSGDWIFNHRAYSFVDGPGRVICLMASGSTWNTLDKGARRNFIETGLVECVITLPAHIFESAGMKTTMIIFSHGNLETMMVDATNMCEKGRRINTITDEFVEKIVAACSAETEISRSVKAEEIVNHEYNLNPAIYLTGPEEIVENGVELGSIATLTRGAQLSAAQLDELTSDTVTNARFLMLANIQNGIIDEELPYIKGIDEKLKKYCLKNNDLILSKSGAPFKLAVADIQDGQNVLANGNMYVITVNEERADPYYIKAYLESEVGIKALKRITVGTVIPNISISELKKIQIPLPSLEEQRQIADEYRACITELKLLQRRTTKLLDRIGHLYDNKKEE